MKVAISAIGYECMEHLSEVLRPWEDLRISGKLDFFLSVAHGVFPETHQLGFGIESQDGSHDHIQDFPIVDNFVFLKDPTYEKDIRNSTLPYLFDKGFDLLWLLDLQDEIYTSVEILRIIDFVFDPINKDIDWFKINFKNYVFENSCWIDDFVVPRIWKNPTRDKVGIKRFHYDNDIEYKDNSLAANRPFKIVPKNIAFIKHLSWVGSKEYLQRKINFQKIHYGACSYAWDEERGRLTFNDEYYIKYNKVKPELNYE